MKRGKGSGSRGKGEIEGIVNGYLARFGIEGQSSDRDTPYLKLVFGNVLRILKANQKERGRIEDYLGESKQPATSSIYEGQESEVDPELRMQTANSLSNGHLELESSVTLSKYLYYSQSTQPTEPTPSPNQSERTPSSPHSFFQPFIFIPLLVLLLALYFIDTE